MKMNFQITKNKPQKQITIIKSQINHKKQITKTNLKIKTGTGVIEGKYLKFVYWNFVSVTYLLFVY